MLRAVASLKGPSTAIYSINQWKIPAEKEVFMMSIGEGSVIIWNLNSTDAGIGVKFTWLWGSFLQDYQKKI